jgi:hypothetical protein
VQHLWSEKEKEKKKKKKGVRAFIKASIEP